MHLKLSLLLKRILSRGERELVAGLSDVKMMMMRFPHWS